MLAALIFIVLVVAALFITGVLSLVAYSIFLGFRQDYFDKHPIR